MRLKTEQITDFFQKLMALVQRRVICSLGSSYWKLYFLNAWFIGINGALYAKNKKTIEKASKILNILALFRASITHFDRGCDAYCNK
jgi:hypothetical protein